MAYKKRYREGIMSAAEYARHVSLTNVKRITTYVNKYGMPGKKIRRGRCCFYEIPVVEADAWVREHGVGASCKGFPRNDYLTARAYAKRIGLTTSTITDYIEKHGMPATKISYGIRYYYKIPVAEADAWMREHGVGAPALQNMQENIA